MAEDDTGGGRGRSSTSSDRRPVDLVLEGGGVKGIALLGAVLALDEAGYRFERIAGTSAGAIVAALVAAYQRAGRPLQDLVEVMHRLDYSRFVRSPWPQRLAGPVGDGVALLLRGGVHSGDYLGEWLQPLLTEVGISTFADLSRDDPDDDAALEQRYSLVVHTSDLSRRALVRLPWDYQQYGREPGAQRVVDAVHASMAIPFYFRPVQVTTQRGRSTWVDGGLLSNFPITVFDRTDGRSPRWPTWGVKLSARPAARPDRPVGNPVSMAQQLLGTLRSDWNRYLLAEEGVGRRTVYVDTGEVSPVDFGLDRDQQGRLFASGQQAGKTFLAGLGAGPGG